MGEFCTGEICAFDTIQMMLAERKKNTICCMKNELKGMGCFCLNRKLNLEQLRFKIFIPKMECPYLLLLGDSTVSGARG